MSPIGFYGTPIHVLTNKKVDNKAACVRDIAASDLKIAGKTYLAAGTVAGAAGIATAASKTIQNGLHSAKARAGEVLSELQIDKTLKELPIFKKLNSLPTPVKAAIAAGTAAIAIIAPFTNFHAYTKNAAIEGNHEVK